jgi:hypothetical protein
MALADILRNGIALAKTTLSNGGLLQAVTVEPWASQDSYGQASYGSAVTYEALVTNADDTAVGANGEVIVPRCAVLFLEAVAIGPLDRITLADGSTGPIVRVDEGVHDAAGRMMTKVSIGYRR